MTLIHKTIRFQVHNSAKPLHTAWCTHHPKQNLSFHLYPPFCPPPATPTPLSLCLSPHCCLCLCDICGCFCLIASQETPDVFKFSRHLCEVGAHLIHSKSKPCLKSLPHRSCQECHMSLILRRAMATIAPSSQ